MFINLRDILSSNDCANILGGHGLNRCLGQSRKFVVLVLPLILTQVCALPQEKNVTTVIAIEDRRATLNCSQASEPVKWSTNATAGQSDLHNKTVLIFERVMQNDSGIYVCNGSNTNTYFFQLIVHYAAQVIDTSPSVVRNVRVGNKVTLKCDAKGLPKDINISWYKDNKRIGASKNSLIIEKAKCEDGGKYVCFPTNSVGNKQNGSFDVSFVDKPTDPVELKFNASRTTATSLTLKWTQRKSACHTITKHFHIKYCEWSRSAKGCVKPENFNKSKTNSFTLIELKPFTNYSVWVKAVSVNETFQSDWSSSVRNVTSKAAPSKPTNLRVPKKSEIPVTIVWGKPEHINGPPEELEYRIIYKYVEDKNWSNVSSKTNSYKLDHLAVSKEYMLKVQAQNQAGSSPDSDTVKFYVKKKAFPWVVVGIVIGVIITVALIVVVAILSRKRLNCKLPMRGFFSLKDSSSLSPLQRIQSIRYEEKREPISVQNFPRYVALLHSDSDFRFSNEFEAINGVQERSKKLSWLHSQKSENQLKNRFTNVVAYDHSRVVLSLNEGDPNSHYINANYVDGYKTMNSYIAAQGPLANTRADFWRMIWEQNCQVVVMITNIMEKGRHKCTMYWPSKNKKTETHGPLQITFLEEEFFANYTIRTLEVKPVDGQSHYSQDPSDEEVQPMVVKQYHFTSWPDHGAPAYCYPVLDFIVRSTAANKNNSGPIVVHCSAGVGRSGAYIVIDSMMRRIHDVGNLDVFGFLAHIRHQRNHLVQEESQYIFVHDALVEYVKCDFILSIKKAKLKQHLAELRMKKSSSTGTGMEREFQRLTNTKVESYRCKEAARACNISKNRNQKYIPVDSTRMKLYPRPGEEGSDYINASYLDGFLRREAYIAAQHPLQSTTDDFWRMIWQENSRCIVMLLSQSEWEEEGEFHRYLPPIYDSRRFGSYEVTVEAESTRGDVITRDIKMIKIEDPSECRQIRHFHYLHWEKEGLPWSGQTVLQLINKTDEWQTEVKENAKKFEMIGPVVVHCSSGMGRTGVFCALYTLCHQLQRDDSVSVYHTAHLAIQQRPYIIETQKQYEFIYDTILEYIEADCSLYLV